MKNLFAIKITSVFVLFCLQIQAQSHSSDLNSVIKLGLRPGGIEYEHKTGLHTSVNLALYYNYKGLINKDDYDFQITPEFRYYLSNGVIGTEGFYLGSYLFYKDYIVARNIETNNVVVYSRDDVKTAGIGLKTGFQFNIIERISLDFGMGLGYNLYRDVSHKTGDIIINESTHHLNFTGGLAIGFRL
jgi:hypothetical protein